MNFYLSRSNLDGIELENNSDVQRLREGNKDALNKARQIETSQVRAVDETDHIKGDINAPVQFIIYSDFECPFCAHFSETVKDVEKNFGDQVVIAFRHYPLFTHEQALPAAEAAECASEQGQFWQMHDALFEANLAKRFDARKFKDIAKGLGLDEAQFNMCYETEKYKDKIQEQWMEGKKFGVNGTPGSFVNGEAVIGAYPFDDFTGKDNKLHEGMKSIIERHLEK